MEREREAEDKGGWDHGWKERLGRNGSKKSVGRWILIVSSDPKMLWGNGNSDERLRWEEGKSKVFM